METPLMELFRIVRGSVQDVCARGVYHRQGWWWHSTGTPKGWDFGYAPEGPFLTKEHARRHLWNTRRLDRIAKNTCLWPSMPSNAGWCPGFGGAAIKPTMRPLKGTRFFGQKLRNYRKEMGS